MVSRATLQDVGLANFKIILDNLAAKVFHTYRNR